MKINLTKRAKLGLQVATAVAEEILNNAEQPDRSFGQRQSNELRPILANFNGKMKPDSSVTERRSHPPIHFDVETLKELYLASITYRFDHGIRVRVTLCEYENASEPSVVSAEIRYYPHKLRTLMNAPSRERCFVTKKFVWGHEQLRKLKQTRSWNNPKICDINRFTDEIYLLFDTEYDQYITSRKLTLNERYEVVKTFSYSIFDEESRDRASREACSEQDLCNRHREMIKN